MAYCEESSAFARTMTEFILASKGLSEKDPIQPCLNRVFSILEKNLLQGGLCAEISQNEARSLIKARLALEHPQQSTNAEHAPALVIADKTRVYLQRDFAVERNLAEKIALLAAEENGVRQTVSPCDESSETSALTLVRRLALTRPFCVIFGGPGTGKTTCLAGILETLFSEEPNLVVYLAAPTGKAAARMREALEASVKTRSDLFGNLAQRLRQTGDRALPARTLHRWLYALQDSGEKPSPTSPLDCDLFVLDEASMLDARLAEKLLRVLNPDKTRLILLGDPFQLRSVGPGSVFADLCNFGHAHGFAGELRRSFRFDPQSGVGTIAHAVNNLARKQAKQSHSPEISQPADVYPGTTAEPVRFYLTGATDTTLFPLLGLPEQPDDNLYSLTPVLEGNPQELPLCLMQWIDSRLQSYSQVVLQGNENEILRQAQRFRILCAMREGPVGVNAVNAYAVKCLQEHLSQQELSDKPDAGRMIIIRKNDDDLGLYNGDMGVVLPGESGSVTQVLFTGGTDGVRRFSLSLLPEYETAFAITIHQSQGSEYEDVALVLPTQTLEKSASQALVTNELIYTGITRVKDTKNAEHQITAYGKLSVFSSGTVLKNALLSLSQRKTGFKNRLVEEFSKRIHAA